MTSKTGCAFFLAMILCIPSGGDTIKIGGRILDNVYIVEDGAFYHVHIPGGTLESVSKKRTDIGYVRFTEDSAARALLFEQWRKHSQPVSVVPAPSPETRPGSGSVSLRLFKKKKNLQDLCLFEAEYEQWLELSEEQRTYVRDSLLTAFQKTSIADAQTVSSFRAAAVQAEASRRNVAAEMKAADQEAAAAIGERLSDGRMDSTLETFDIYRRKYEVRRRFGVLDDYYAINAIVYGEKYLDEAHRALMDAARIKRENEAQRRVYRQALAEAEKKELTLGHWANVKENVAIQNESYYKSQVVRILRLDEALANDYRPRLRSEQVFSWDGGASQTSGEFSVRSDVWKLAVLTSGEGSFRITVLSSPDKKAVATLKITAPGSDFSVIDIAGTFCCEIKIEGEIAYHVAVFDIYE